MRSGGWRGWWRDTLAKRLFVLMWAALVVSHLVAWLLVTQVFTPAAPHQQQAGGPPPPHGPGPGPGPGIARGGMQPTFPSLPPTPGVPQAGGGLRPGGPALSTPMLLLDYGVRVLLIGLAAWLGARWLAAPVGRLVVASRALAVSLGTQAAPPRLHERGATVEVQEATEVFNEMADQLHGQFRARGLLMASVSHDLRTPLTRIRIRLEALEGQPGVQRCIEDIREMDALIDTALQVFRDSAADEALQPTDVFALVQSLTDDLQEQGAAVTLQGASVVLPARAVALKRVVSNLLGNALRHGNRADVQIRAEGADVLLLIEDQGPGIPEAELARVFEPFYRVEASRSRASGGSGLGLYIARDLLQRQGGSLRLVNKPAGGFARRGAADPARDLKPNGRRSAMKMSTTTNSITTITTTTRRDCLAAVALTLAGVPPPAAAAQPLAAAWPSKPIRLLVGFPGGSTPDLAARVLADALARAWGAAVVVDNRPGAAGSIAADQVAKASDDHTLGVVINGSLTSARLLNPKLPFDPARDFCLLSLLATAPLLLVAAANVPGGAGFFAAARQAGVVWNYGSVGIGSVGHLGMELLKSRGRFCGRARALQRQPGGADGVAVRPDPGRAGAAWRGLAAGARGQAAGGRPDRRAQHPGARGGAAGQPGRGRR